MEHFEHILLDLNQWLGKKHTRISLQIRPYNTQQLSLLYECCYNTFRKRIEPYLEEIGPRTGHAFMPLQVAIIFARLGPPAAFSELSELPPKAGQV